MQQENVVAQQACPEEIGADCVQHDGPDAVQAGLLVRSPSGSEAFAKVRAYRKRAWPSLCSCRVRR